MINNNNEISFSVANKFNIFLNNIKNKNVIKFLCKIYKHFDDPVLNPKFIINVEISNILPKIKQKIYLGKDAFYGNNTLCLKSGHYFVRDLNCLHIGIPSKVKRGRVPFKRAVPGRHITDEIIEPILQIILLKFEHCFLHASSIFDKDKLDILMAWRGTGKTNSILKALKLNKEVWSDDLTIIDSCGNAYPYLRPIRIYSYNINKLSQSYIKKYNLNFKKFVTPPWQPLCYFELTNTNKKSAIINTITYLNNPKTEKLSKDADDVMNFEQIFFSDIKLLLRHSGVLSTNNTVKKVLHNTLNFLDK